MRSCLVTLLLLAGIWPAAAQSARDEWIFDSAGSQLEGLKDHTLRPWSVDRGVSRSAYFDEFTPGDVGLDFAPSFRIIAANDRDQTETPRVEAAHKERGVVTYRYDTKRRKFTIRRGLGRRES